jgi:hypothetical protein
LTRAKRAGGHAHWPDLLRVQVACAIDVPAAGSDSRRGTAVVQLQDVAGHQILDRDFTVIGQDQRAAAKA